MRDADCATPVTNRPEPHTAFPKATRNRYTGRMLTLNAVSIRRGGRLLLAEATATIQAGERCGLVGANGCGKSSLFAMLLGELDTDAGRWQVAGQPVIAHVAQDDAADGRSALEHVLDGDAELRRIETDLASAEAADDGHAIARLHARLQAIDGYSAAARGTRLLHGLGFAPGQETTPLLELSGGWRMRVHLARALMCRSDLLLLDEPTNHLDLDAVVWLEGWLNAYPGTLLVISHDRDFLDRTCRRILHIDHGRLQSYSGNYADFERQRTARLAQQQQAHARQQADIARIQGFVERFRAKASKARQAQSRLKALERMQTIMPMDPDHSQRFQFPAPLKLPEPLLLLDQARCGYEEATILRGVSLEIAPGDRIGVLGRNGAGKSTLIRSLAGSLPLLGGSRQAAQDLRIGYFAQHQVEQLEPESSPLDHLLRLFPELRPQAARDFLGGFGFTGDQSLAPVGPFSGGERARLVLALLAAGRPNLLLLDEPTNHLDLDLRDALAIALQTFAGAVVVIAHDRHLLSSCSDRLLVVSQGSVVPFDDDLDGYARWLGQQGRERAGSGPRPPGGENDRRGARRASARRHEALRPLRKAVEREETALGRTQAALAEVEERLADPALYAGTAGDRLAGLTRERHRLTLDLERIEQAWLEAADALETAESLARQED